MRVNVLDKISMEHLYDDEELEILQEIKEIVDNQENQDLLKDFVA